MIKLTAIIGFVGVLSAVSPIASANAETEALVADLSNHLIAITTGFTGAQVLSFGAIDGPGDIVIVVRGPNDEVEVRRKAAVSGIWVTADRVRFDDVPGFYAVAASRPLEDILDQQTLKRLEISTSNVGFSIRPGTPSDLVPLFSAALIHAKQVDGLYAAQPIQVTFPGSRLFRAEFMFPAQVPTGNYLVEVMLVRNKEVVAVQTTPLVVSKIGAGAEIYDFAHENSAWYGLIVIGMALFAGWIAHLLFRRR